MATEIVRERVVIPVDGHPPMAAYLAHPAAPGPYAAVIIGMELFGVTPHIRKVADRLAERGYLVLAPDFYHRIESGTELTYDSAGRARGFELLHQVSRADALQDVQAAMHFLRRRPGFRGRIGFLGFSVGGHIGYLAATQLDLAACALFYAGWLPTTEIELSQPEPTLTLTPGIAKTGGRIIYFVGEQDFLVTCAQREQIARALEEAHVRHDMVVYPNAQHGFFCDERDTFDPASRDDAWDRTLALFASELSR
ncbi:MAG: dienelactone hydrolase family protein [Sulfobacillus sp.]